MFVLARGRNETIPDQWQSQILARILLKYKVIMVTDAPRAMVENMHMKYANDIDEALKMADNLSDKNDAKVTVIPDGVSVIVQ